MHYCCEKGYIEICYLLIEKDININIQDIYQKTSLHYSCEKGYYSICNLLIQKGIDLNIEDNEKKNIFSL